MEYIDAIMSAVRYIENHLTQKVRVADIAKHVGYSNYHFQRLFHQVTSQTIGQYMMGRKLTEAGKLLREGQFRVVDVSYQFGFESHEAFSRAFKARFSVNPHQWKQKSLFIPPNLFKEEIREDYLKHLQQLEPENVEQVRLNGLEIRGYQSADSSVGSIYECWNRLYQVCLDFSTPKYGLIQYPFSMEGKAAFTYTAAVKHDLTKAAEDQVTLQIRPGKYQVFWHKGELEALPFTYRYIYGTWLVKHNVTLSGGFDFEYYGGRYIGEDAKKVEVKIYIPVEEG
ncbi:helix-turn-helix domain-containing protein [Paenibacillus sp. FSL L8-0470]|uniref:helix-turn-helix domain-containing protein n=1 Tax=unclassified Paenibacillus TaxID=185978 RepID=UPI0030F5F9E6